MNATRRIHARVLPYGSEDGAISLPIGGGLHAWYGVRTERGPERLTLAHMVAHGWSIEGVRAAATAELWAGLGAITAHRAHDDEPVRLYTPTRNLAASTLLLSDLWDALAADVRGPLVARVINADDVRFCGAHEPKALERLMRGRLRRPLLQRTDRGWARFELARTTLSRAA